MIKKSIKWVVGVILVAICHSSAFADQSVGYQEYLKEGVKAYQAHDDKKALRCFKIAEIYDPSDKELQGYIDILEKRAVTFPIVLSKPPEDSIGYRYYLKAGVNAFLRHDKSNAVRYLNIAIIFDPESTEADRYLQLLSQESTILPSSVVPNDQGERGPAQGGATAKQQPRHDTNIQESQSGVTSSQPEVAASSQPEVAASSQPEVAAPSQPSTVVASKSTAVVPPQPEAVASSEPATSVPSQPQVVTPLPSSVVTSSEPTTAAPQAAVYTVSQKRKPTVILLSQIVNNRGQAKPRLEIELNSAVILEGKNIQRYLVIDQGFIGIKTLSADRIEVDGLRIGTTFLHIWDDNGRHTFYVEVVFPKPVNPSGNVRPSNGVYHSDPFTVTYSNDWNSYYAGKNIPSLRRQSYEFDQSLAIRGETPYGIFDTSASYDDFDSISKVDTYTLGLSQIPVDGTSNFNLRGFDATRYLSPLTMPSTRLRGAFGDVDLLDDKLGLSVSHGLEEEQAFQGFNAVGQGQFYNAYIDAVKVTLFPKSVADQYSFNYATAYGSQHPSYLTDHVYSLEGQHKINDYLMLNAEDGSDASHNAQLAALKWKDGDFKSGLNFRNVDKDYSTISTLPSYQGETGASWTTDYISKDFEEDTFFEAYQDHLDSNPNNTSALNYDANGHVKKNFAPNFWGDTDFNFVDTLGELSPNRSLGFDQRFSKSFGIWNSLKGTVFGGGGYQDSHSSTTNISDYDREDVVAGIQLPLTKRLSSYANYEYDWLNQPGSFSNPSVFNTGLGYQRQVTTTLSFNTQLDFHDELGVKSTNNSFLSGEQSIIVTAGFNYNPTPDINIFADTDASQVLSHIGNPSYDDFEFHVGMRLTFGGTNYWDPLGTVSGFVFKDKVGDGKYMAGDEGIAGVKVKVGNKEATTDKNGRYSIQIRGKGVDVMPVLDTIPGSLIFSTPQAVNVRVFEGRTSHVNFGLISQTGIYGLVFVGKSATSVPNDGDQFVGKVRVILDGNTIQRSDSHGAFYFRKVAPGKHIISVDINSIPISMVPLVKLQNKIDVAEGTNYMFNIPVQVKQADVDQEN